MEVQAALGGAAGFDLTGVYTALGITEGGRRAAPPHAATQRIQFLASSVMAALDEFSGSSRGFPLSLPALPSGAAALLRAAAEERLRAYAVTGQHVSHLALESHCLAVLEPAAVDAAIAAVAAQVSQACRAPLTLPRLAAPSRVWQPPLPCHFPRFHLRSAAVESNRHPQVRYVCVATAACHVICAPVTPPPHRCTGAVAWDAAGDVATTDKHRADSVPMQRGGAGHDQDEHGAICAVARDEGVALRAQGQLDVCGDRGGRRHPGQAALPGGAHHSHQHPATGATCSHGRPLQSSELKPRHISLTAVAGKGCG